MANNRGQRLFVQAARILRSVFERLVRFFFDCASPNTQVRYIQIALV